MLPDGVAEEIVDHVGDVGPGRIDAVSGDGEPGEIAGVRLAAKVVPGAEGGELRTLAIQLRDRFGSQPAAVVLIGDGPKPAVVVATNSGARDRGLKAGQLVRVAAVELGGKGGGKDDLAQGGGTTPAAAHAAVDAAVRSAEATIAS